ncbi:DUF6428 family protein [Bradyrhizobium prioriisuperbiae]|uniref:DUF6428 family protein n=1 Tax=Bradyrhizobium prioriisuperbiae TaxID=2854389 RepID=UPI0028E5CA7B|nr:DUF6428 family protein [Bradyrhizobium prioritasuperba]
MPPAANPVSSCCSAPDLPSDISAEISTAVLLGTLAGHAGKALVFYYDGRDVKPSYHVTEVKSGRFHALDCGANPENWDETFIQLWDIVEESHGHMPVAKFLAIMRKVSNVMPFHPDAKLTFEVSDGVAPMQLYKADDIAMDTTTVRVRLNPRPSSCKPRDRWLEQQPSSCCVPRAG